jgi:hypothetical protein
MGRPKQQPRHGIDFHYRIILFTAVLLGLYIFIILFTGGILQVIPPVLFINA